MRQPPEKVCLYVHLAAHHVLAQTLAGAGVILVALAYFISFTPKMEEEKFVEFVGMRHPRIGCEG